MIVLVALVRSVLPGILVLVACATAGSAQEGARGTPTSAESYAFVDASVVPMSADTVLRNQTVLVRGGKIVGIGPAPHVQVPEDARIIRATGMYLIPGLVDFHVHLRAESELASYLRHGVTTVVNMRGSTEVLTARQKVLEGSVSGPRIYTAGPLLDGSPPIWSGSGTRVLRNPEDAREAIREHVRLRYDLVKVYNNLDPDLLEIVVQEAHAVGLPVAGHLPRRPVRTEGLTRGLAAGIDLIAHGEEVFFTHFGGAPDSLIVAGRYTPPSDDEVERVAERIAGAGVAVIPNLSFIEMYGRMLDDVDAVFTDPEFELLDSGVQQLWREENPTLRDNLHALVLREAAKRSVVMRLTRALHSQGATLLVGTDASAPGLYPGRSAHLELHELVRAGMSPYDALAAGTRTAGAWLSSRIDQDLRIGQIAPGYSADLVLLEANPLRHISAVTAVRGVMSRGRWHPFRGASAQ